MNSQGYKKIQKYEGGIRDIENCDEEGREERIKERRTRKRRI